MMMKKVVACTMVAFLGVSAALAAKKGEKMPTEEEIANAEPLIQELMKGEMDDMRAGKKKPEDVGDAAIALVKKSQTTAEKFVLYAGAFDQYMRGGQFDKAYDSIKKLRRMVPEWSESDERVLIYRSLRNVEIGKGGPVRNRYEKLRGNNQYALKLKKLIAAAEARPADSNLQFQVGMYHAALNEWPSAVDAFISSDNAACAAAATLEKESAPLAKTADAWWAAIPAKPEFLATAIRNHAAKLYRKALNDKSFTGLQRVQAERRVKEARAARLAANAKPEKAQSAPPPPSALGAAQNIGVDSVGGTIKEGGGFLTGFANNTCAKVKGVFDPKGEPFEAVVEFRTGQRVDGLAGILNSVRKSGFSPFFIFNGQLISYLSSNGTAWDIANGAPLGIMIREKATYRVKITWDGKQYDWYLWERNSWKNVKTLPSDKQVFGGVDLQLGNGRDMNYPFSGKIDLNKCYICVGDTLLWEGVKGAYRNVNK